jgi:hypothetical protein
MLHHPTQDDHPSVFNLEPSSSLSLRLNNLEEEEEYTDGDGDERTRDLLSYHNQPPSNHFVIFHKTLKF